MAPWRIGGCLLLCLGLARAESVYVDNVLIVLDCSGSMQQVMRGTRVPKLDAAKGALKSVMATLPQSTQVGLLVFGGKTPGWVYPLGARRDAAFFGAVDGLTAGGGTPLGEYMKTGADRLLQARQAQYGYGSYRLLLVTDGQATDGNLTTTYAPLIQARGIALDVIGVDMAEDHLLAKTVNSYRRANDPAALSRAIQEVFAEVGKGADGGMGPEAFGELSGFPAAAATAILTALASSGNEPIGSKPAPAPPTSAAGAPPAAGPGPGPAAPPPAPRPSPRGSSPPLPLLVFAVVLFVVILIIRNAQKGSSGRRR